MWQDESNINTLKDFEQSSKKKIVTEEKVKNKKEQPQIQNG